MLGDIDDYRIKGKTISYQYKDQTSSGSIGDSLKMRNIFIDRSVDDQQYSPHVSGWQGFITMFRIVLFNYWFWLEVWLWFSLLDTFT